MSKVNLGFIGGGFMGQAAHIVNYHSNPKCSLTALCEAKPLMRAGVKDHFQFKKAYATHQEILNDPEVQAIVLVTRRENTGPLALEVLKAGKSLLTEKPMCHTVEQARMLVAEAEKKKLTYTVGFMRRHDEGVQHAKALIDRIRKSGEFGALNFVRAHCYGGDAHCAIKAPVVTDEPNPPDNPTWDVAPQWLPKARIQQYAWFMNVFSHNVNLLRYLTGETPQVDHVDFSNQSGGLVVFNFGGKFRATLEAGQSTFKSWDDHIELFFDTGRIRIDLSPPLLRNVAARVTVFNLGKSHEFTTWQENWSWSFKRQADAFVDDLLEGREPISSGRDSLLDIELIEAIWKKELSR